MSAPIAETAAAIALHFGMLPERQHAGKLPKLYEAAVAGAEAFLESIAQSISWGDEADYLQTLHNYAGRILEYMADHMHEIPPRKHLETLARESIYYYMQPKFSAPLPAEDIKILRDLIVTGFEGGIGYWGQIIDYVYPKGTKAKDFSEGGKMQPQGDYYPRYVLLPLTPGGAVILRDVEENPDPPERVMEEFRVKAEKVRRTLKRHHGEEPEGPEPEFPQPHPEEVEGWEKLRLDYPAVQKAWALLKIQYPKVYQDVLDENYDAATGDLFIQLAVFGEQVYG